MDGRNQTSAKRQSETRVKTRAITSLRPETSRGMPRGPSARMPTAGSIDVCNHQKHAAARRKVQRNPPGHSSSKHAWCDEPLTAPLSVMLRVVSASRRRLSRSRRRADRPSSGDGPSRLSAVHHRSAGSRTANKSLAPPGIPMSAPPLLAVTRDPPSAWPSPPPSQERKSTTPAPIGHCWGGLLRRGRPA